MIPLFVIIVVKTIHVENMKKCNMIFQDTTFEATLHHDELEDASILSSQIIECMDCWNGEAKSKNWEMFTSLSISKIEVTERRASNEEPLNR